VVIVLLNPITPIMHRMAIVLLVRMDRLGGPVTALIFVSAMETPKSLKPKNPNLK
jgi:hypothetical protein